MQAELGEQVLDGCNTELARFCAEVTPGEGRLLACLYAHGDKLSGQCDYALYNAAVRLERAIDAITYVAQRVPRGARDALRGGRGRRGARAVPEGPRQRAQPRLRSGADRSRRKIRLA